MENSLIGIQIARCRKAAGLTQEELGKAVGVSTQAVSRWECGGTPDVTLLPAIADRLGITIDALFGRDNGEAVDIFQTMRSWIRSLPREQVMDQLNRLVWSGIIQIPFDSDAVDHLPYLKSCHEVNSGLGTPDTILCSNLETDQGIYFGVCAEDLAFTTLLPKPEKGYDAYFPDHEKARSLFSLLLQPGCLELLEFIMAQEDRFYTVEFLAEGIGSTPDALAPLLERLRETGLVHYTTVGTLQGLEQVYSIGHASALVPLFYLVRILSQDHMYHYLNYSSRSKPLL